MNPRILHTDVQEFIRKNLKADLYRLILNESPFEGISSQELAGQVSAMNKACAKLPTWFAAEKIYYPNIRNLEQSSGEIAAAYKASLFRTDKACDITGGFGVDSYFISKNSRAVEYWETDKELAAIAAHNFRQLGIQNVSCNHGDGLEGLKAKNSGVDLIYLDPSRRTANRKRVFMLSDCLPDVPGNLSHLFRFAPVLLVKTSPLLDLSAGMAELQHVKEIHIVAVKNEVKEVLWVLEKGFEAEPLVKTINFGIRDVESYDFPFALEKTIPEWICEPHRYLYEPNAAIMKSGGFNSLSQAYRLGKLHSHTHLYTSDRLVEFPGRKFRILNIIPYSRRSLLKLSFDKANISTRNFPESVSRIRRNTGIKDGGQKYLFFTRATLSGLIMIECEKI